MRKTSEPSQALIVFALFTFLGLVYTWPLVLHFFKAIPYSYYPAVEQRFQYMLHGDHLQAYYHITLLKLAAMGEFDWFANSLEFATKLVPHRDTTYFLPVAILYLPFAFISGPMAYNVLTIISFGLCGLSMYLWVKELTGSHTAALAAGFVFNFAPVRFAELLGGHPAGHAMFMFPLVLFFFDRAVARRSPLYAAFAGLFSFFLSVQYAYFEYYLLMFLIVYIPWRLAPSIWGSLHSGQTGRAQLRRLAIAGVPFALGLSASIWYMLGFKSVVVGTSSISGGRTMAEVALYSPTLSALWDQQLGWIMYLGFTLIAIPVSLAYIFLSSDPKKKRLDSGFFIVVFLFTYTLAFGVTLNEYIPLYSLFYDYFPYFNYLRAPAKIMVIVLTVMSALVGYSIHWAMTKKRMTLIAGILFGIIAIDYHPRANIGLAVLDEENQIYKRVSEEANGKYILDLPIWPGESDWSSLYIYYALQSKVPTINGYSPIVSQKYIDNVFKKLWPINSGDLTEEHVNTLLDLNVGLIVFHEEAYPGKISAYPSSFALEKLLNSPYLKLLEKEEPLWLFKIVKSPLDKPVMAVTSPLGSFYQAEYLGAVNGERTRDPDAMNGLALAGLPGKKGAPGWRILNQGPYRTFPSGEYRAIFRVKCSGAGLDNPVAKIDVAGDEGRIILAEKIIRSSECESPGKYRDFALEYKLTPGKNWQVEFRTYSTGNIPVFVDSVYILRSDQTDPKFNFEAERMFYTGRVMEDKDARDGKAIMSVPSRDPNGVMMYGPYRFFEAGDYTAHFRLKSSPAGKDDLLARLYVISVNKNRKIAEREVYIRDLPGPNGYGEVALSFSLPKKDVIEFRVIFNGKSKFFVDYVSIKPRQALSF